MEGRKRGRESVGVLGCGCVRVWVCGCVREREKFVISSFYNSILVPTIQTNLPKFVPTVASSAFHTSMLPRHDFSYLGILGNFSIETAQQTEVQVYEKFCHKPKKANKLAMIGLRFSATKVFVKKRFSNLVQNCFSQHRSLVGWWWCCCCG